MTKSCVSCRWEPEWELFDKRHGYQGVFEAGKCKYPLPMTITPYIGRSRDDLYMRDSNGKAFVDTWSGAMCYAWESKPAK